MTNINAINSRKNCVGSCIVPILGVIAIVIGLFAFSQLSSESYREAHSEWVEVIGLTLFAAFFTLIGIIITFAGVFVNFAPVDKEKTKSSSGCLAAFFWFFIIIVFFQYIDNWSWRRLEDYADNIIYAEFPSHFTYDKLGAYDFPLSFYQYRPSIAGNQTKHYIDLEPNQYQLSIRVKDSLRDPPVKIIGQQLHVKNSGDHVLTVDIKEANDTPYRIKREFPFHNLVLQDGVNMWIASSLDKIPALLQQKAKIQVRSFGYRSANSLTQLQDGFYLKDSLDFIKIPFGESEKIQIKTRPPQLSNSYFQGHQGLIYSFGGRLVESKKQADNRVYYPEKDEWQVLSAIPLTLTEDNKQEIIIVAVYSAAKKLFVLVRAKDHFLYQFDIAAKQQWKLVKQFSLANDQTNWQYLNNKTLVAFNRRKDYSGKYENQFVEGNLKLLDLESYQVKTLSTRSKIISYSNDYFNLHPYKNELYLYSSGRFYFLKK